MDRSWELLHSVERVAILLVMIAFVIFSVPSGLGASPDNACFNGGCHASPNPKPIDRTLYDSNPHGIIKCIDCHANSTSNTDPNHGLFIRQLNGSNITGPMKTQYYSENFSLCYYCHAEAKVVGILPDYIPSDNHVNTPIIVSSIGTNFINIDPAGYHNGSQGGGPDIPTNIHWNHLDAFGSINSGNIGKFDYNMSGSRTSYQSCTACHNVHGTNYPKMTKNDLAITYGSDANGTFGYIGSDAYLYRGGDVYCAGCHTSGTTFRYYRNEQNLFEDCIACHADGVPGNINKTAFGSGVHININTTDGAGLVNNSDCWSCHFNRDMNRGNIRQCENCHTGSGAPEAPSAPKVTRHLPAVTNYSCDGCHSKVAVNPGAGFVNVTSHYASRPAIQTSNYCDYCHGPEATSPFPAINKTIPEFDHDDPGWNGNATCRTCHTNSSVQADPVANDTSSFHDITTELGDVFNGTRKADCVICHIQKAPQFVSAPDPPPSHPDTSGMNDQDCYGCHGSGAGTQQQKLHSVAPTGGGCIACHSNNATRYYVNVNLFGRHKNVNTADGTNNATDADCKTCHFGASNITMSVDKGLGAANQSNTYFCNECHTSGGSGTIKPTDPDLIKDGLSHGSADCRWCHIAGDSQPRPLPVELRYHPSGPGGTASGKNCLSCHYSANLPDLPFHAPGEGHEGDIAACSECHSSADNHAASPLNAFTPPSLSLNPITSVTSGVPAQVQATVTDDYMQIAAAQYQVTNASGTVIEWTNMTPRDGRFNSASEVVNASIDTSKLKGNYTVKVRGMASAPKTDLTKPYYPLNGMWSGIVSTQLTVLEARGYINGTVKDSTGNGIAGAMVGTNTGVSIATNASGFYSLSLVNGSYQLAASKEPEYYPNSSVSVTVTAYDTVTRDIILALKPTGTISGVVTNASSGLSLSNVYIRLNYSQYNATTDSAGNYVINNVPIGTYQITASKDRYFPNTSIILITGTNTFNIALKTGYYYYFAEGYVTADNTFREYVTIGNPNDRAANVVVSHMLANGSTVDKQYTINPNTRFTETVGSVLAGANAPLVISDIPVIVERPMYFYKAWGSITDGHNTIGATSLSNTWYFAEGYISPNFRAYVTIQNPNAAPANVSIKHVLGDGSLVYNNVTIGATSRYTETVSSYVSSGAVSFVITSDLPVVAERPIYFDKAWSTVSGGHNTIGASSLSKTWYFAEGYVSTDNTFREYLTIGNPNNIAANVTVSHMLANGSTIDKQYTIPANTRFTETVANVLTGANSIKVTSDVPVMAERPMYFYNAWGSITGGHNTIGATELSNTWYFAEGYISPNFRAYVTVQNPHAAAASVSIKHVLGDGSVVYNNVTIGATSRYTETVSSFVSSGAVSFVITSDLPVVAERPIYFDKAWGTVSGGHNTIGYSKLQ